MSSNIAKRKSKSVKKLHHHHRMKTKRKKKKKRKDIEAYWSPSDEDDYEDDSRGNNYTYQDKMAKDILAYQLKRDDEKYRNYNRDKYVGNYFPFDDNNTETSSKNNDVEEISICKLFCISIMIASLIVTLMMPHLILQDFGIEESPTKASLAHLREEKRNVKKRKSEYKRKMIELETLLDQEIHQMNSHAKLRKHERHEVSHERLVEKDIVAHAKDSEDQEMHQIKSHFTLGKQKYEAHAKNDEKIDRDNNNVEDGKDDEESYEQPDWQWKLRRASSKQRITMMMKMVTTTMMVRVTTMKHNEINEIHHNFSKLFKNYRTKKRKEEIKHSNHRMFHLNNVTTFNGNNRSINSNSSDPKKSVKLLQSYIKNKKNVTIHDLSKLYNNNKTNSSNNIHYEMLTRRIHGDNDENKIANYNKAKCLTSLSPIFKFTFVIIEHNYENIILNNLYKALCIMEKTSQSHLGNQKYNLQQCISKYFKMYDCSNIGLKSYFDFTFVQNPLKRAFHAYEKHVLNMNVVSLYGHNDKDENQVIKHITTKLCTFKRFLKLHPSCKVRSILDEQWPNIFNGISQTKRSIMLDKVGKIEDFNHDMLSILVKIFGINVLTKMKQQNKTFDMLPSNHSSKATTFFTNNAVQSVNAIELVKDRFKADWKLLEY